MKQSKRGTHVRDESGGECCGRRRAYLDQLEGVSGSNRERESGVKDDLETSSRSDPKRERERSSA